MDSLRMVAGLAFAISVFLLIEAWIKDHREPAPEPARPTVGGTAPPSIAPPAPAKTLGSNAAGAPQAPQRGLSQGQRIQVSTDMLLAEIDTAGGELRRLELTKYRDTFNPQKYFVLLDEGDGRTYVAQSGLIGKDLPNHNTVFKAERLSYQLAAGKDDLVVELQAAAGPGALVKKTYTFHRGSYVVDMAFEVKNLASEPAEPYAYYQLVRDSKPAEGESKMVPTFSGIEVFTEKDKLHKMSFADIAKQKSGYSQTATDGWVALVQHYFLSAWLPKPGTSSEMFVRNLDNSLIAAGVIQPMGRIEPGQTQIASCRFYAGPQEQDLLKTLAPGLELTVDYGWLRVLAVPLFWVLNQIHSLVGNWGVAIIVLTVMIKLLFYPLSAASYKSMARMKVLAPKLQRLKERYGDDRQRMHQAMVELYKTEKINPLGGCLPIVVQIPVFIALYWVLLLSVELRQAPFVLVDHWIQDLSRPDPYFVLPVLMGATMFIQTWLNPTPPDPMQAKLMKIMPIGFSIFFFFFPSGLVLYWLVNNILSIAQQWRITQVLERAKTAHGQS